MKPLNRKPGNIADALGLNDPEQPHLFDPGPAQGGPLSVRQFFDQAQWHGTTQQRTTEVGGYPAEEWADKVRESGVPVHSGSFDAAKERGRGGGVFYPVRPLRVSEAGGHRSDGSLPRFGDRDANYADAAWNRDRGLDPSPAVAESVEGGFFGAEATTAHHELNAGRSVPYTNAIEDAGSVAYVSPPNSFQTLRDASNFDALPEGRRQEFLTADDFARQGVPFRRGPGDQEVLFSGHNPRSGRRVRKTWKGTNPEYTAAAPMKASLGEPIPAGGKKQ